MDKLFDWFCMMNPRPRLRSLEISKFDDFVLPSGGDRKHYNWNTILPLFKDTLTRLSMSGYREPIKEEQQMVSRFSPSSRMLTCRAELTKLIYLKVPLHYVSSHRQRPLKETSSTRRDSDDADEDVGSVGDSGANANANDDHQNDITADNIRQHIISELTPLAQDLDVIEYENYRGGVPNVYDINEYEIIRERKTYRIEL